MKVLILAGGFATRLWPLTENRAKPLLKINGKTILAHIIKKIPPHLEVIILTNQRFEKDFEKEIKRLKFKKKREENPNNTNERSGRNIKIFLEDAVTDNQKLGALGAISACIDEYGIKEDLIVLAGDNLLPDFELSNLYNESNKAVIAVWSVRDLYEARKFGVIETELEQKGNIQTKKKSKEFENDKKLQREENDKKLEDFENDKKLQREENDKKLQDFENDKKLEKVKHFEEKPTHPKSKLVSTGCMFFGKDLLPMLQEFSVKNPDALGGVFPYFLEKNKCVYATKVPGDWFDVGSFETYLEAHKKLKTSKNLIKSELKNTTIEGKVYIESGCKIKNSVIIDSIIYANTQLNNCYITNSIIDENGNLSNVDLCGKLIRKNLKFHG